MSKEKLKKTIRQAINNDPHKQDILKVSLFGSYAYGKPNKNSDIDLLIEFRPNAVVGYFKLVRIQRHLSEELNKKVDLLTPGAISKYIRDFIINHAELIYERK